MNETLGLVSIDEVRPLSYKVPTAPVRIWITRLNDGEADVEGIRVAFERIRRGILKLEQVVIRYDSTFQDLDALKILEPFESLVIDSPITGRVLEQLPIIHGLKTLLLRTRTPNGAIGRLSGRIPNLQKIELLKPSWDDLTAATEFVKGTVIAVGYDSKGKDGHNRIKLVEATQLILTRTQVKSLTIHAAKASEVHIRDSPKIERLTLINCNRLYLDGNRSLNMTHIEADSLQRLHLISQRLASWDMLRKFSHLRILECVGCDVPSLVELVNCRLLFLWISGSDKLRDDDFAIASMHCDIVFSDGISTWRNGSRLPLEDYHKLSKDPSNEVLRLK